MGVFTNWKIWIKITKIIGSLYIDSRPSIVAHKSFLLSPRRGNWFRTRWGEAQDWAGRWMPGGQLVSQQLTWVTVNTPSFTWLGDVTPATTTERSNRAASSYKILRNTTVDVNHFTNQPVHTDSAPWRWQSQYMFLVLILFLKAVCRQINIYGEQ